MWLNAVWQRWSCIVSTLCTWRGACQVFVSTCSPEPSGEPEDLGPGGSRRDRAAPDRPRPAAGGGSPPGPGAGPCSAGRTLHKTCRVQLLRDAAIQKYTKKFCQTEFITDESFISAETRSSRRRNKQMMSFDSFLTIRPYLVHHRCLFWESDYISVISFC